ncbi:hypothetical protein ACJ5NV_08030 [Loktanella agnita]|uniref:hypothetical protein n=1 Tax=Loktanella agnita TaxID=287097 RepID=UPI0039889E25
MQQAGSHILSEEQRERLRALLPKYSTQMLEADWLFLSSFDPYYFLRLVAQFKLPAFELQEELSDGEKNLLADNIEVFESVKASFYRLMRYLSSESLVLLMLSGYPFGPMPKLAKLPPRKIKKILEELSSGAVPSGFELKNKSTELVGGEWLNALAFDGLIEAEYANEVFGFLSQEAKLLQSRDAINAFKHGRMQKPVLGQAFQVTLNLKSGQESPLISPMEGALQWVGWDEVDTPQKLEHAAVVGFEETTPDADYEAITAACGLKKLVSDVRILRYQPSDHADVWLPDLSSRHRPPQRAIFSIKESWTKQQKHPEEPPQ